MKKRILANLSALPDDAIELLRQALKGGKFVDIEDAFGILSSRQHGAVEAVKQPSKPST